MNANMRMKNVVAQYEELMKQYKELEELNKVPQTVYVEKEVHVQVPVFKRIGREMEAILDLYQKNTKDRNRQLLMAVLYYHKMYKASHRDYLDTKRLLDSLTTEYLVRLYEVQQRMIARLVEYLLRIYTSSVSKSTGETRKSMITFNENLQYLRENKDEILYSMLSVYEEFGEIFEQIEFRSIRHELEKQKDGALMMYSVSYNQ